MNGVYEILMIHFYTAHNFRLEKNTYKPISHISTITGTLTCQGPAYRQDRNC